MDAPSHGTPSRRYQDVARFFRAYAGAEGIQLVTRPATVDEVERAERELGSRFPMSYRLFQLEFGELQDAPLEIYSVRPMDGQYLNIIGINLKERTEAVPRLPIHLIAFSDSGGGDLLCFETSRRQDDECPVVWWDHELDENQAPENAAPSFLDWIEQELKERAAEERGSLLDGLPHMYKQWMGEWARRFREKE